MTLFASLNTAVSGLNASMAALQTVGHNIANASTPGFSRQRVDLQPQKPLELPQFSIGRGVNFVGVSRIMDQSLLSRLRDSASTLSSLGERSEALQRLEALVGPLSGSDVGALLDRFFGSLQEFSANPEDLSARGQVLANGESLADQLNFLALRIREFSSQINGEIRLVVDDVNRLAAELGDLNGQVVAAERGGGSLGSANDLRDRRDLVLRRLSDLVKVQAVETTTGEVNVLVGSAFLVFGRSVSELATVNAAVEGVEIVTPVFAEGAGAFGVTGGRLQGLLEARDDVLAEAARDLDLLANTLAREFNRVQSTGQGLERFQDHTGLFAVPNSAQVIAQEGRATALSTLDTLTDASLIGAADPTGRSIEIFTGKNVLEKREIVAFDPATGTIFFGRPMSRALAVGDRYQIKDVPFPVSNGSFDVVMTNEVTGVQQSFNVVVDLDGVGADSTVDDLLAQIDAVPGLDAFLTNDGRIRIRTLSPEARFSFANDTSGFLAAVGLNAFFAGTRAADLAVNPGLRPSLLSGGRSNAPGDNSSALAFTALRDLAAIEGGITLEEFYQGFVGGLGVQTAEFRERFENQALIRDQLDNQRERISGVNIDEEAVDMIQYQRTYQASARFIGVINDLLDTLINGI